MVTKVGGGDATIQTQQSDSRVNAPHSYAVLRTLNSEEESHTQ